MRYLIIIIIIVYQVSILPAFRLEPSLANENIHLFIKEISSMKKGEKNILPNNLLKINNLASLVSEENIKILIENNFYKSLLNFFSKNIEKQRIFPVDNLSKIQRKRHLTKPSKFSAWFLDELIKDLRTKPELQKRYISTWLYFYLKASKKEWKSTLYHVFQNFNEGLLFSLSTLSQNIHVKAREDKLVFILEPSSRPSKTELINQKSVNKNEKN